MDSSCKSSHKAQYTVSVTIYNIKKLVKEGKLDIKDDQSIKSFAKKYIVAKEYVVNAVRHIYDNTVSANLRKEERASQTRQRKLKKFGDYDWQKLVEERKLNTLYVYELDKYLRHTTFLLLSGVSRTRSNS